MTQKLFSVVTFLFFAVLASAQEHFYYYKGEKIALTLNTQRVNIRVAADFDSLTIDNLGFKLSNFHEDKLIDNTFFGEIDFNNTNYTNGIENLKEIEGIIGIFPHFQKSEDNSIGTSDLCYVKLKDSNDLSLLENELQSIGGTIIRQFPNMPLWVIIKTNPSSNLTSVQMANMLYESEKYADIDPAFMFDFRPTCANDPMFGSLWGLDNTMNPGIDINVCPAWDITQGSGVKVAVVDSGIDLVHNDLQSNISNLSYDCETQTSPSVLGAPMAYDHGTQVGGIIGAVKDNNLQVVGVAPQSELMSISHSFILTNLSADLANGIIWAYLNGADVINCSWGDSSPSGTNFKSQALEDAIADAITLGRNGKGTVVVFATGNEDGALRYPASQITDILAVGAIDSTGNRWVNSNSGSNFGTLLDVVAPGSGIISTIPNNGTSIANGTSLAAPHAAGVAALVLSVNPDLTGQQVRDIIERTAKKVHQNNPYSYLPTTGRPNGTWDDQMGYGLINAYEAVMEAGILDLYMRNSLTDNGDEPDLVTQAIYDTPDIWIRNDDDNGTTHQNAEYNPSNPNYVYVRVHNRGTIPSTVNDTLELYWAKGSTSLNWKDYWDGTFKITPPGGIPVDMGGEIAKKQIPVLQPGQSTIVKFEWRPKNPTTYNGINPEPWHFCLAARIESGKDPMNVPETVQFAENVKNNNNIAWKNLSVVDILPNNAIGGVVYAGNPFSSPKPYRFKFRTETLIYEEAEVRLKLSPVLFNAWNAGGQVGSGIELIGDNVIAIKNANASIENVILQPNQGGTMNLTFNFLTAEYTGTPEYMYYVEQRHMDDNSLLGGEAYLINTFPRDLFYADAGGNREANYAESVILSATDVGEDAVYKWYDTDNNLLYQGKNYTVTVYDETAYKLEVTATADGYKDYDNVAVSLRSNAIDNIYPNPTAGTTIQVDYTANNVNSAYITIVPVYGASGNGTNYPINLNQNTIQIDISGYIPGSYKVILYCDGNMVESKNLLIN